MADDENVNEDAPEESTPEEVAESAEPIADDVADADEPTVLDADPTLMDESDDAGGEAGLSAEEQAMLASAMGEEPTVVDDPADAAPAPSLATAAVSKPQVESTPVSFAPIAEVASGQENSIEFIFDLPVEVSVRLGETKILIRDLLQLGQGSVVELDKLAGEPLEVVVNDKLMARGEVVVVNEKFGVRLTDIIAPSERIHSLK